MIDQATRDAWKADYDRGVRDNDRTGKIEQFDILTNPPEKFLAYIGTPKGGQYPVATWTGDAIGTAVIGSSWDAKSSFFGTVMSQFYATIAGREYTGRSYGEGMSIVLRETAASKRKRAAA